MNKNTLTSFQNSPIKSVKHSTYFNVYDKLFSKYVNTEFTFIEIGIFQGGSLFMWRDYFGDKARIIGIDINEGAKKWEKDGFEIYIGSQSDPIFWRNLFKEIGNVDVVLDDGGHEFDHQIITTESVIPHINDGGLLLVEDTHTSYMNDFGGPSKHSFISYSKNIVDGINYRYDHFKNKKIKEPQIFSIHFYESFVAFDIDRGLCSIDSKWVENSGKPMPEDYFVETKSGLRVLISKILSNNKEFKRFSILVHRYLLGFKQRILNSLKLKKYFKF